MAAFVCAAEPVLPWGRLCKGAGRDLLSACLPAMADCCPNPQALASLPPLKRSRHCRQPAVSVQVSPDGLLLQSSTVVSECWAGWAGWQHG